MAIQYCGMLKNGEKAYAKSYLYCPSYTSLIKHAVLLALIYINVVANIAATCAYIFMYKHL